LVEVLTLIAPEVAIKLSGPLKNVDDALTG